MSFEEEKKKFLDELSAIEKTLQDAINKEKTAPDALADVLTKTTTPKLAMVDYDIMGDYDIMEPKSMSNDNTNPTTALDILKTNAATALKTAGANAANKTLIDITKRALRDQLGVDAAWADTPMGQAIIMNALPALMLFAMNNQTFTKMLPEGVADKVSAGAALASQGAMNQTAQTLIETFTPYLVEMVGAFSKAALDTSAADTAVVEQHVLSATNGAHKVEEFAAAGLGAATKPATA